MWWAGGFSPLLEQLAQIPRGLSSLKPSPRISIPMENNISVPCPGDHGKPSVTIFWFRENSWEPIPIKCFLEQTSGASHCPTSDVCFSKVFIRENVFIYFMYFFCFRLNMKLKGKLKNYFKCHL